MAISTRLGLIVLAVRDLPRSVKFYTDAFGWPLKVNEPVYAEFDLGDGRGLSLYRRENFGLCTGRLPAAVPPGEIAGAEFYFFPTDLDAAVSALVDAGARVLTAKAERGWGHEAAYFADPDGYVIVLARPIARA
jgi:catechol 2,3-dioxygenase-like lactoylglutathione lyase family enzyme